MGVGSRNRVPHGVNFPQEHRVGRCFLEIMRLEPYSSHEVAETGSVTRIRVP
jgi:hypothetical protein